MKKILFAFMTFMLAFTSCQQSTGSDEAGVSPTPPSPTTEATEYTVSVTQPDFGGTVSVDNSKAKASETVTITTTANDGFELETISVKNGEATVTVTDKKFTMPSGNVTVNAAFATSSYTVKWDNGHFENKFSLAKVKAYITQIGLVETTHYSIDKKNGVLTFTSVGYAKVANYLNTNGEPTVTETPTTDGGEDNGTDEPPATANEYTVSVASGIKGGHFEVSPNGTEGSWSEITSKTYTKDTTIYVRPVCNNSFYKLVSNTVKYTLSKGGEGFLSDNGGCITITDNTILGATFEINQGNLSTLNGEITSEFNNEEYKKNNYKCGVFISSKKSGDCFKSVEIVFGFSEYYYGGLVSSSNDGILGNVKPTYYYVLPNKVTSLSTELDKENNYRTWVRITGDSFVPPFDTGDTGRIYVLVEDTDGNKSMYAATKNFSVGQIRYTVNID